MNTHALFLSHGGGPLPLLGDPGHSEMVSCLTDIASSIPRPGAIIVVSAHWEAKQPTVTSGEHPALVYDYHGFPPESYSIEYPCPGHPALAKALASAFKRSGEEILLDDDRGYDHGVFIPLKIMYPEADIPCIQLSLVDSLDPHLHIHIGQQLRALAEPSLLLVGSGFTFHNMKAFFTPDTPETTAANVEFENWLLGTMSERDMAESDRTQRLLGWDQAPHARYCHPREEHLLPLHVCYGYGGAACSRTYELQIMGKKTSMFLW